MNSPKASLQKKDYQPMVRLLVADVTRPSGRLGHPRMDDGLLRKSIKTGAVEGFRVELTQPGTLKRELIAEPEIGSC